MFVGNDAGVEFGLLFQKLFIPSGGVMPLYFLRNYGVLLAVSVLCCTPLIEKLWDRLSRHAVTKALTILALLTISQVSPPRAISRISGVQMDCITRNTSIRRRLY